MLAIALDFPAITSASFVAPASVIAPFSSVFSVALGLSTISLHSSAIPAFHAELRHASLPDWSGWRTVACGSERAEVDPHGLAQPTMRFSMNFSAACRKTTW